MELNAVTRSVNDIFSPSKKYLVPRFQREFSWGDEEIGEFWDDIAQQISVDGDNNVKKEEYFIGCIVLVGEDTKPDYLIVDGQQRLTTLTILLRAIVERLKELGEAAAAKALYENVIEGTDNDGKKYFKLINETPKPYFQNELQSMSPEGLTTPNTEEEQLLLSAYNEFSKKIKSFKISGLSDIEVVKNLRDQVLNYLKFILVTAKNEDDAYTIFETLNARGLSLTSVDLIKNWIFKNYTQVHPNDNAKDIWNLIRKQISEFSDLETFFRHYWNSKYSFASDDRLYKSFKDFLKAGKILPARDFLLELRAAAGFYRQIGAPEDTDWKIQKEKSIGRSLVLLNQYRVTQVRPFLLALLECRAKKTIGQTEFINIVSNLENFHFVFSNICQDRASGLEGKYTRAAKNLHLAGNDKAKAKAVLKDLNEYLKKKRPNLQRVTDTVLEMEFTSKNELHKKAMQTIFAKIERHLHGTNELLVGSFSLEHVQDQSTGDAWIGRIGNIIPLCEKVNNGIKSGLDFKHKKNHYKKSNLKIVKHFLTLNLQDSWTESDSQRWQKEVVEKLYEATSLLTI